MERTGLASEALSSNNARVIDVPVTLEGGRQVVFRVKQASMKVRRSVGALIGASPDVASATKAKIAIVIACVVDELGKPVFTNHDTEVLENQPAGGWIDVVSDAAFKLMAGTDPEVVSKNSEATQSGS